MRRLLLAALALCAGLIGMATGASAAESLGPIVLGQPRTEKVIFCLKNKSLDKLIALEQRSLAEKNNTPEYLRELRKHVAENKCEKGEISYTPKNILRQWSGRTKSADGTVTIVPFALLEAATMTVIRGQVTRVTMYVIAYDPPAKAE